MSIFRQSFKPYIRRQINARQQLISSPYRDARFSQYVTGKNSWCRMSSFVNYDNDIYKGKDLSRKYILESGTLFPQPGVTVNDNDVGKYSLRSGVGNKGGSYGGDLGDPKKRLGLRPMPGITSVEMKTLTAYGSIREATVKFYAWDVGQLEDLEILFMRTGYTVMLEWGWSMFLDTYVNDSGSNATKTVDNLDISKVEMKNFISPTVNVFNDNLTQYDIYNQLETLRHKFSGNYDGMLGKIRNFSWKILPNGGYECTTVIISMGDVLDSLKINSTALSVAASATDANTANRLMTKFEALFLPLLDAASATDYLQQTLIGTNVFKSYLNNPNNQNDSVNNIDLGVTKIAFRAEGIPSELIFNRTQKFKGSLSYISLGAFLAVMSTHFNLYDPRKTGNNPLIKIEIPHPAYKGYGNGLCLASADTVSIDPMICMIKNSHANFVTNLPAGFDILNNSPQPNSQIIGAGLFPFNYGNNTSLGIIGNIYICVEHIISTFVNKCNTSDGQVDMKSFIQEILESVSYALGSVNDFGIFVTDSSVVIIDTHYVEDPADSIKDGKYQVNILGTNSVIRDFNINSKIFESQATMVAIGAGVRENMTSVETSTYNLMNKGLTDRIVTQTLEYDAAASISTNNSQTIAQQDTDYKKNLARMVLDLQNYLQSILVKRDLSVVSDNKQAANSNINSVILKINTDANYKAIIPISLELTFDGIGGLTVGEIFTVNPDTLPREYINKNLGFIVTHISNRIENSDWITTISTQCCLLNQDKAQSTANNINKNAVQDQINNIKQDQAAQQAADAAMQILAYNSLIDLIVAIFGALNPSAITLVNQARGSTNMSLKPFIYNFQMTRPRVNSDSPDESIDLYIGGIRQNTAKGLPSIYQLTGFNYLPELYPGFNQVFTNMRIDPERNVRSAHNTQIAFTDNPENFINLSGQQYILNAFNGSQSDSFSFIQQIVKQDANYKVLNDKYRTMFDTIVSGLGNAMNSAPSLFSDQGISNAVSSIFTTRNIPYNLQRLDPQGNPSIVIPLNVNVVNTDNY